MVEGADLELRGLVGLRGVGGAGGEDEFAGLLGGVESHDGGKGSDSGSESRDEVSG